MYIYQKMKDGMTSTISKINSEKIRAFIKSGEIIQKKLDLEEVYKK